MNVLSPWHLLPCKSMNTLSSGSHLAGRGGVGYAVRGRAGRGTTSQKLCESKSEIRPPHPLHGCAIIFSAVSVALVVTPNPALFAARPGSLTRSYEKGWPRH